MRSEISSNHALHDYIRTCQTNAMFGTLESNDITYSSFLNGGYFLVGYDLTVSFMFIFINIIKMLLLIIYNYFLFLSVLEQEEYQLFKRH